MLLQSWPLSTTVVFGMLFATMIGIFVIPVFYVVIQRISERTWPFKREASPQIPRIDPGAHP